jgi:Transposase DDE domain group 1
MAGMRKMEKPSPTESPLLFAFDPKPAEEMLTALGGIPLVVQAFRSLGLPGSVKQHVVVKERQRGYDEATFVESFVVLNAAGGECLDDFERLRADPGLGEMIGHEVPSPEAARKFLYAFHEEDKIQQAKQQRLPEQIAYIPSESEPLAGLGKVNQDLLQRFGERCPEQKIATVDQDTTIIECRKQEALHTYEGPRGYQPMLAVWAEMDAVLADEFRDGNVPAQMAPLTVAKAAFAALPKTVSNYYYRGDSACHEKELLRWLSNERREEGPQGHIGFAISVRMSEALREAIREVPEKEWQAYGEPEPGIDRECAEVVFVSNQPAEPKDSQPLRYIAIRLRQRQGGLFADGSNVRHFAVLSNLWDWKPVKLIEWHREKAGTIERVHDVLKNDLAAGVLPSKYFGANAAWLRLAVIAYNVLTALKRLALPADLLTARPKRLRFLIFHTPGRLVHHARQLSLRLATAIEGLAMCLDAVRLLPRPA